MTAKASQADTDAELLRQEEQRRIDAMAEEPEEEASETFAQAWARLRREAWKRVYPNSPWRK